TADGNNDCNLPADEIGGQCSKPTVISLRPAVFDRHAAAFDKTGVIQPLSNDSDQECIGRPRTAAQDTDNRKLLLCARREGQRSRAANQRDELATFKGSNLHSVPASQGRIAGYRIGEEQSAGVLHPTFIFAASLARSRPRSRRLSSRRALRAARQVLEFLSESFSRTIAPLDALISIPKHKPTKPLIKQRQSERVLHRWKSRR